MNDGNWKMKCVDDGGSTFCKTGKVYEVKNGRFKTEDCRNSSFYESFNHFIVCNIASKWVS